ncbi:hypothetical protein QTH90_05900 [Variovorax sp. J2P1-59]|uniref:COG4315 family predicted lipoprotein n=1 Tax=Variovorax flavidus TaxID=3053501 RepID=UPI00257823B5|nr:hypothetical protein [Variovorax sp. J2P1-59]MDM0073905.1 hypothetical protein [Variovorax sp. J2P1-59]
MRIAVAGLALTLTLLAGCTTQPPSAPTAAKNVSTVKVANGILVNDKGLTLYTFDKDAPNSGRSVCNGDCAVKWPPVMAGEGVKPSGSLSVIARDDGRKQWAFKGQPLYTWPEDQEPGDVYGDNYNKVWHVIKTNQL